MCAISRQQHTRRREAGGVSGRGEITSVDSIRIIAKRGKRQTFAGFGTSLINWAGDYQKLMPDERQTLSEKLWKDLKFQHLRLWLNINRYAAQPGKRDWSEFRHWYVESGIIGDAKRLGARTLLLAPDGVPAYLCEKSPQSSSQSGLKLKAGAEDEYAHILADFIAQLRREAGVSIDVTGVQNEPNDLERFLPEQIVRVVKTLRTELDRRGMNRVGIIAPETASADDSLYRSLDALRMDTAAWRALRGIASHTYNMGATAEAERRKGDKEYWMTEASDNGPEEPGDMQRATSLASRFLSDMNHGVTHWIHFVGFENPDPKDDATRILRYTTNPLHITLFQKFYFYRQLAETFVAGGVLRSCVSDAESEMTWTYGKKPRVTVACLRNPDGGWGVAISNYTASTFRDDRETGKQEIDQGGYAARRFTVLLKIEELAGEAQRAFSLTRSRPGTASVGEGEVILRNGQASVVINPLELVTLRSNRG